MNSLFIFDDFVVMSMKSSSEVMMMERKREVEGGTRNPLYVIDDDWFLLHRILPIS